MSDRDVDLDRRRSFRQLLGNLLVSAEEVQGHRHCSMDGLENIERAQFEKLVPGIDREFDLFVSKGRLMARNGKTQEKTQLFDLDLAATTAFNLINNRNSIGTIIRTFSENQNWKDEDAFPFVKSLILGLVKAGVCRFANPLEE